MTAWIVLLGPLLWPWLLAALALGLPTGAVTCAGAGPGRTGVVLAVAAGAAVAGLAAIVALALVPGRTGLWLELGLALLLAYGAGCGLGCLARRVVRA